MITITDDVKACSAELSAAKESEEKAIKALSELAASGCKGNELLNLTGLSPRNRQMTYPVIPV